MAPLLFDKPALFRGVTPPMGVRRRLTARRSLTPPRLDSTPLRRTLLAWVFRNGWPVARGVAWSQWYAYDGFGNMTEKESTTGTVMTVAVNPATNQIVGQPYDANGNMLGQTVTYMLNGQQITGPSNTWDAENRLSFQVLDGTPYQYTYDPSGRRVVTQNMAPFGGVVKTTFYGAAGERVTWGATSESYVRFAGRTISLGTREVRDRLGSVRATETGQNFQYMPYGEAEGGVVADGRVRFGTYVRDSTPSAQDYAGARYYSNVYGRFFGADPGGIATANPNNPSSWNRYAYVGGDPVDRKSTRLNSSHL